MAKIINIADAHKLAKEVNSVNFFTLEFDFKHEINSYEPENYILNMGGKIIHNKIPEDQEISQITAGRFGCRIINLHYAENDGANIFDIFDSDAVLLRIYESLFESNSSEYKPLVKEQLGDEIIINRNILLIDRIDILPEYRRHKLGLAAAHLLIQHFGNMCGVVICYIGTVDWERISPDEGEYIKWIKDMKFELFTQDEVEATKKLTIYFSDLGFRLIGSKSLYGLSMSYEIPTLDELGFTNWLDDKYKDLT